MTAQVIEDFFCHEHNRLEVATQDYEAAKTLFREVMENRGAGIPEHEERFREAAERQTVARDLLVKFLT